MCVRCALRAMLLVDSAEAIEAGHYDSELRVERNALRGLDDDAVLETVIDLVKDGRIESMTVRSDEDGFDFSTKFYADAAKTHKWAIALEIMPPGLTLMGIQDQLEILGADEHDDDYDDDYDDDELDE